MRSAIGIAREVRRSEPRNIRQRNALASPLLLAPRSGRGRRPLALWLALDVLRLAPMV